MTLPIARHHQTSLSSPSPEQLSTHGRTGKLNECSPFRNTARSICSHLKTGLRAAFSACIQPKTQTHTHIRTTDSPPSDNAMPALEYLPGLRPDNTHEILSILAQKQPYARLALGEALVRSKLLSNHPNHDALTQFLRAKTAGQLPPPEAMLGNLGLLGAQQTLFSTGKTLANLIDRHMPALIQNTLDSFQQDGDKASLMTLGRFLNTLAQSPAAQTTEFWQYPFHTSSRVQLGALCKELLITCPHLNIQTLQVSIWKIQRIQDIQDGHLHRQNLGDAEKNDKDIILLAIQKTGNALEYASDFLKNDEEVVFAAVQHRALSLRDAAEPLRDHPEIVMMAVKQYGPALEYASSRLRGQRDIVMTAIHNRGTALQFASAELRADRHITKQAIRQNGNALAYAAPVFQKDREMVLTAVSNNGHALAHVQGNLKNDHQVVLTAVKNTGNALLHAPEHFKADREIAMAAVSNAGSSLQYLHKTLRADLEIVRTAVQNCSTAIEYADQSLQANPIFHEEVDQINLNERQKRKMFERFLYLSAHNDLE